MASQLLEMRHISKSFPGVQALDDVNFNVCRAEVHALMGENGAGKSTLIKVLTGVHKADAGQINFQGKPFNSSTPGEAEAGGISTVYQEVNLIPHLSVAENICLHRQPTRFGLIRWGQIKRRSEAAMQRIGIAMDVSQPLASCSIALQQMTAIARALDISARLLVLDEPTSSLDEKEVEELFQVIRRLRDDNLGIIFITHFIDQVYKIADRITVLRNGRLVAQNTTASLPRIELIAQMIGKDAKDVQLEPPHPPRAAAKETEQPFVQVRQLGKTGAIAALDMDITKGRVVGLAGLLGSGRTETARLLFGIDRPDSGTIQIDGRQTILHSPRRAIAEGFGFSPEDRKREGLIPELSVRENIILAMQGARGPWRAIPRKRQIEIADQFIASLGIKTPSTEQAVKNLSGGNQQKVLLARWLATEPRLLILDEPTRGIDVGAKAEIEKLILSLCEKGMAIVFISSELEEVVRVSDLVIVLRDRAKVGELHDEAITEQNIMHMIAAHVGES